MIRASLGGARPARHAAGTPAATNNDTGMEKR